VTLELDRDRISAVVDAVADRLDGDWILIGGGLVALWLEPRRVTEDVDLVGVTGSGSDRLALLGLARDLDLPVEALNSAADYFVYKNADWREQLEPFRTGAKGRIFRPTATLFLLLKVSRLSDEDLTDCLALLDRARTDGLTIDVARVAAALAVVVRHDDEARQRRDQLQTALTEFDASK